MILQESLEIIPTRKKVKYYREKGYVVNGRTPIKVKIEDVSDGCKTKETRICDCCGEQFTRTHRAIIDSFNCYGKDLCLKCLKKEKSAKTKETNLKKYRVEFPMQSLEIKEKAKETTIAHYGCEYSFQNPEIQKKVKESLKEKYGVENCQQIPEVKNKSIQTNLKKYGSENVFSSEIIKEKIKETILKKYGCESPTQSLEVKEKRKKTFNQKYGVDYPLQYPDFQEKVRKTLYENNTTPTSSQQKELFEILKKLYPNCLVELNYPLNKLSLDIRLQFPNRTCVDVEYDGWYWHQDKKKDRARDEVVKKQGYKILRIKSGTLLPSEEQLKQKIDNLIVEDYSYTDIVLQDFK